MQHNVNSRLAIAHDHGHRRQKNKRVVPEILHQLTSVSQVRHHPRQQHATVHAPCFINPEVGFQKER